MMYSYLDFILVFPEFEALCPDLAKANSTVETVEDSQGHREMGDDGPDPIASIKLDLKTRAKAPFY